MNLIERINLLPRYVSKTFDCSHAGWVENSFGVMVDIYEVINLIESTCENCGYCGTKITTLPKERKSWTTCPSCNVQVITEKNEKIMEALRNGN